MYIATPMLSLGAFWFAFRNVPFPQKYPLILGVGSIFLNSLCLVLYQVGTYSALGLMASFYTNAVMLTTGTLALAISVYSYLNNHSVSAQWYALPTGASPLAMLSQYVPLLYIHFGILSIILGYALVKYQSRIKTDYMVGMVVALWIGAAFSLLVSKGFPNIIGSALGTVGLKLADADIHHLFIGLGMLSLLYAVGNPGKLKMK